MQTIYIDISKKGIVQEINAKQNDVGRKFQVLLFENGVPYNAEEKDCQFSLWYSGESGYGNYDTIDKKTGQENFQVRAFDVNENCVTVELAPQILKNPGGGIMCLSMSDAAGQTIGLWNIPYDVEEIPGYPSERPKPYYHRFVMSVNGITPDESGNVEVAGGGGGGSNIQLITWKEDA